MRSDLLLISRDGERTAAAAMEYGDVTLCTHGIRPETLLRDDRRMITAGDLNNFAMSESGSESVLKIVIARHFF
jgi:hypothetical protein